MNAYNQTGTVYVTKHGHHPDGAILEVLDLQNPTLRTVVDGLNVPNHIVCGPDNRLYFGEPFVEIGDQRMHRLWRCNRDGSDRVLIQEWDATALRITGFVFSATGDMYLGTLPTEKGIDHQGLWKIRALANSKEDFSAPEQVLAPDLFQSPISMEDYSMAYPGGVLPSGPYHGDLLIVDSPRAFGGDKATKNWPTRVLRALQPNFDRVEVFIPQHRDPETGKYAAFFNLAINSSGDVFITDDENGKLLQFNSSGKFEKVFAELNPIYQVTIGSDGLVYVTNFNWQLKEPTQDGLFVFDPEGNLLDTINSAVLIEAVAIAN